VLSEQAKKNEISVYNLTLDQVRYCTSTVSRLLDAKISRVERNYKIEFGLKSDTNFLFIYHIISQFTFSRPQYCTVLFNLPPQSASFLSSRLNWVAREYCSSPLWVQGGRHTRLPGRGWEDLIPTKGQTLWFSMYTIISLRLSPTKVMQSNYIVP
jgi:hypothetical protein